MTTSVLTLCQPSPIALNPTLCKGWSLSLEKSSESSLPCPTGMSDSGPHPLNCGRHAGHGKLGQGCLEAVEHGPPAGQKADTDLGRECFW